MSIELIDRRTDWHAGTFTPVVENQVASPELPKPEGYQG